MNVLVPMASKSQYFPEAEYPFPKPLIELGESTMAELVINNLATAAQQHRFIFILSQEDCRKFHLDRTLSIITAGQCDIIRLNKETRGAACSALMAIDFIDNETPLLIANGDQIFDDPIDTLIAGLTHKDAGVVTFDSVHPRWSYVRVDESGRVVETAEKRPLSRHAIAGLYHFRQGKDFVQASMRMIQKDESVNGLFYIAPSLNQMILAGKEVGMSKVDNDRYHTFYIPQKIKEYEMRLNRY